MSETKTIDVSDIRFSSTVYPTDEDMALWDSLSPDEQRTVIERDLKEAEESGFVELEPLEDRMARVRSKLTYEA